MMESQGTDNAAPLPEQPEPQKSPEAAGRRVRRPAIRLTRKHAFTAGSSLALIIALAIGVAALTSGTEASNNVALSVELAARATLLASEDPRLAADLALASYRIHPGEQSAAALLMVLRQNNETARVIKADDDPISAVAESGTSQDLYSASLDGMVRCWNPATGANLASARLKSPASALAADPSQPVLIAAEDNGDVVVWNVSDSHRLTQEAILSTGYIQPSAPASPVTTVLGLGFFNQGRQFFEIESSGLILTWDTASRRLAGIVNLTGIATGASVASDQIAAVSPVFQVDTSPNHPHSVFYVVTTTQLVIAVDPVKLTASVALNSSALPAVPTSISAVQLDDRTAVAVGSDDGVSIWDMTTGKELGGVATDATGVEFDPDSGLLVIAGPTGVSVNGWLGDIENFSPDVSANTSGFYGGSDPVVALPSEDSNLIAAGYADGSITLIEPGGGWPQLQPEDGSTVLAFNHAGDVLLTTSNSGDRSSSLYSVPVEVVASLDQPFAEDQQTYEPSPAWWSTDITFYANQAAFAGEFVAVAGQGPGVGGVIMVWKARTGQPVRLLNFTDDPTLGVDVRYDPKLRLLVGRDSNGLIETWSYPKLNEVFELGTGQPGGVLVISPDGQTAIAPVNTVNPRGDLPRQKGRIALINLRTHGVHVVRTPQPVTSVAYLRGDRIAVLGNNTLTFLTGQGRATAGQSPIQLPGIGVQLAASPDGKLLAVAMTDGQTLIYDVSAGSLAYPPLPADEGDVAGALAWDPAKKVLAVETGHQEVQFQQAAHTEFWDLNPADWAKDACRLAAGGLSVGQWRQLIGSAVPYQHLCPSART